MAPIIDELEKEYRGRVEFFLVDIDQAPKACDEYQISGTPTMFFYRKNSSEHEDKLVGEQTPENLRAVLDKLI
jgi:thiol-disulfide isomerase/thioredoxin